MRTLPFPHYYELPYCMDLLVLRQYSISQGFYFRGTQRRHILHPLKTRWLSPCYYTRSSRFQGDQMFSSIAKPTHFSFLPFSQIRATSRTKSYVNLELKTFRTETWPVRRMKKLNNIWSEKKNDNNIIRVNIGYPFRINHFKWQFLVMDRSFVSYSKD